MIATLFLPAYFRGEMYTAYELMRVRFGNRIRRLTAGTFLVLRALAEGVRVFAISIVISIILGTGEMTSIVVIVCLTLFYTYEGGLTAVIWTDVIQMVLYVDRRRSQLLHHLGRNSRRLVTCGRRRRSAGKISSVRFPPRAARDFFHPDLQLLGGNHRRMLPHHRQPRHRTIDGAAPARRAAPNAKAAPHFSRVGSSS